MIPRDPQFRHFLVSALNCFWTVSHLCRVWYRHSYRLVVGTSSQPGRLNCLGFSTLNSKETKKQYTLLDKRFVTEAVLATTTKTLSFGVGSASSVSAVTPLKTKGGTLGQPMSRGPTTTTMLRSSGLVRATLRHSMSPGGRLHSRDILIFRFFGFQKFPKISKDFQNFSKIPKFSAGVGLAGPEAERRPRHPNRSHPARRPIERRGRA